jgi:hypothetical protein
MKTQSPKPLPRLLADCQKVFNAYIRARDKDKGCISDRCKGQVEHAGHYFSQGHHSALRFDELNVNGCCARCNTFLSGNLIRYRQGLVSRYGEQRVLILESRSRGVKKWSRGEVEVLIRYYKNELKKL